MRRRSRTRRPPIEPQRSSRPHAAAARWARQPVGPSTAAAAMRWLAPRPRSRGRQPRARLTEPRKEPPKEPTQQAVARQAAA
ncbi:MAG TPA: hypothetical protein VKD69_08435, partial [Vicinamibacterales bacterium]|nr:hypothetical protein [Vicinamibacterales bacterium]